MDGTIVEQNNIKGRGVGLREGIHKELHVGGVQLRQDQKEAVATGGCDGSIEPAIGIGVLAGANRLDPAGRDPTALGGH